MSCKKIQKPVQIVKKTTLKKQEKDQGFKDINVMIVTRNFNPKEDQINFKKLSLKSICTSDKL